MALIAATVVASAGHGQATDAPPDLGAAIECYRSRHLIMHTDLPGERARELLRSLEWTLRTVSDYWGRPSLEPIECIVVEDLAKWPPARFAGRPARAVLRHIGGATEIRVAEKGSQAKVKAIVYATTSPGIAQHELVHAYCAQVFGRLGPEWYKEGMAEVATHRICDSEAVDCPPALLRTLRTTPPRTIAQIVHGDSFTTSISASIARLTEAPDGRPLRRHRAWRPSDARALHTARQSYHWSWAACYFLCQNPNYHERFAALGRAYLRGEDTSFEQVFCGVMEQLEFEFQQFVRHVANGYRVDLCHWDWTKDFAEAEIGDGHAVRVHAARGFQPSGLRVSADETYQFVADGCWSTQPDLAPLTADGSVNRHGRLVGVLVHDFKPGPPFDLGSSGSFTAPHGGHLYLRCHDRWDQLNDNRGAVDVRMERVASSKSRS